MAQFNQVAVDVSQDMGLSEGFRITSLNYAHSISSNERHLLEGHLALSEVWNPTITTGYQFGLLYRYRFDITQKWDLSAGLGYRSSQNIDGGELGYATPTATVRYNITPYSAFRLRLSGFIGEGNYSLLLPSLGVAVRWPSDDT
ncbi:MAG: hypothetical protein RI565_11175 [Schleiferiaceae bacterium]|nr:hypothetical protein [Schleiferiaceae bacterium]